MESKSIFKSIPLNKIDLNDRRFRISTGGPDPALVASIDTIGVLTPPILFPENQSFIIVSGFKRIMACDQLGVGSTVAQILDPLFPMEQCIKISIADNVQMRSLNPVEQARAVLLLGSLYQDDDQLCIEARALGLNVNSKLIKKLHIVNSMSSSLQKALIDGHVAFPVALQISKMDDDRAVNRIIQIIGDVGFGLNRQRELIDWITAISKRDGVPVIQFLADKTINEILHDPDFDRKQKGQHIRHCLRKRRYPEISKAMKRYNDTIDKLKLERGVDLMAPPFFESQKYRLAIEFSTYEELVLKYRNLERVISSPAIESLLESFGTD